MSRSYLVPGSNEVAADVMVAVVIGPGQYLMSDLATKFGILHSTVSRETKRLAGEGWIGNSDRQTQDLAYKPLVPLPGFWRAYNQAVNAAHNVGPQLVSVFEDSIDERYEMEQLEPSTYDFYRAQAIYLGGAAVLGEEFDLNVNTSGNWFAGVPGWRALIDIQVSQIPAS